MTSSGTTTGVSGRRTEPTARLFDALLWCPALAFTVWAFVDPRFRDAQGFPLARICLPVSFALASAVLAVTVRLGLARFGAWLSLSIVGQAASLQLVQAGPYVRYQHYASASALLHQPYLLPLAVVLAQLAAVGWTTRRWWASMPSLAKSLSPWRIAIAAGTVVVTSAALSRSVRAYGLELGFATLVEALNLLTIGIAASHAPHRLAEKARLWLTGGDDVTELADSNRGWDLPVVAAGLVCVLVSGFLSYTVYQDHPHIPDEVSYVFQARYFAGGMIAMPAPPDQRAFDLDLMTYESTRWYSMFPPGWPAVLALGVLARVPWLVNPLLVGIDILLVFALLRRFVPRRRARLVALLLCISPWHLFMGMSLMSHTLTLTCFLIGANSAVRAKESGGIGWAALAGASAGAIMTIRPLDSLIAGLALGATLLWPSAKRISVPGVLAFGVAGLLATSWLFSYNSVLTGQATEFPLMAYFTKLYSPTANPLGFGADRGFGTGWAGLDPLPGHGPLDVMINSALNAFAVNTELLGWSTGSLILLLFCLVDGGLDRIELTMAAFIAGVVGIHSFYWFSGGPDFGARYWFLIIVPCLFLTVRGLERLVRWLDHLDGRSRGFGGRAVMASLLACSLAMVNFVPWRALDKYYHYRGMHPDIRDLAQATPFGRSVVFVRPGQTRDYASAAVYNPIDLRGDTPIYARDLGGDSERRVLEAYRDRPVWFVDGPTLTGGAYRVAAGPVPAAELLQSNLERSHPRE